LSVSKSEAFRYMVIGFILGLLVMVPIFWTNSIFEEVPYTEVEVISVEREGSYIDITANFIKTEYCDYVSLDVLGGSDGRWFFLEWEPIDGTTKDQQRISGPNTLGVRVYIPEGHTFDIIEIKTRHDCNGDRVDKIFSDIAL